MRIRHFEALRPHCPVCGRDAQQVQPLQLSLVIRRTDEVILEGLLLCPNSSCQREYPIIDGIPMIIANLRGYLADNMAHLMARDDLSDTIESVLGDCAGPASSFDVTRHQLGSYARDHYGVHDADEPDVEPRPGSTARVLAAGLTLVGDNLNESLPAGAIADLGCSVGGTTFDLAERTGRLVVGIDLNLSMLRLASSALHRGFVQYPRKRTGVVYDRRRVDVAFSQAGNVDFWACDVGALPFADGTFALTTSLNLIDCVQSPRDVLAEIARVLGAGGRSLLATPYDWSPNATPIEAWFGGHSQRSPNLGASEPVLRALLTPGAHPAALGSMALEAELNDVPWHVRLHDRSTVAYRLHLTIATKMGEEKSV